MKKILAFIVLSVTFAFPLQSASAACSTYSFIGTYDSGNWVNFSDNTRAQQLISSGQAADILSVDENGNGFLFTTDTYFACTKPVLTIQSSGSRGLFIPGRYNHLGTQSTNKYLDLANKLNSWMASNSLVTPTTTSLVTTTTSTTTTTIVPATTTITSVTTATTTSTTTVPLTTTTTIPLTTTTVPPTTTTIGPYYCIKPGGIAGYITWKNSYDVFNHPINVILATNPLPTVPMLTYEDWNLKTPQQKIDTGEVYLRPVPSNGCSSLDETIKFTYVNGKYLASPATPTTTTVTTVVTTAATTTTSTTSTILPQNPRSVTTTTVNTSRINPIPVSSTYPTNPLLTTITTIPQISDYLWNSETAGDSSADWKVNNILLRDVNSYYSFKMCIEKSINCNSINSSGMSVAKFEPTMQSGGTSGVGLHTLIELHNVHITNKNSGPYYSGFYGFYICNEKVLSILTPVHARFLCGSFSVYMHSSQNGKTLRTDSTFRTCFNVSGATSSLYKKGIFTTNSVESYVLVVYLSDSEMYVSPNKFLLAPLPSVMKQYAFEQNIRYTKNDGQTRYSCSFNDYAYEQNQLNIRNSKVDWRKDPLYNSSFDSSRPYRFDLDCRDVRRRVYVGSYDPYDLDRDGDGYGCDRWKD